MLGPQTGEDMQIIPLIYMVAHNGLSERKWQPRGVSFPFSPLKRGTPSSYSHYAPMVNDGEAVKKTQVVKGICNEFVAFAQIETKRDMAEYCTSLKDQATQIADICCVEIRGGI